LTWLDLGPSTTSNSDPNLTLSLMLTLTLPLTLTLTSALTHPLPLDDAARPFATQ